MRTITRSFIKVCESCGGTGKIKNLDFNPNVTGSSQETQCPACQGTKVITVVEAITDNTKNTTFVFINHLINDLYQVVDGFDDTIYKLGTKRECENYIEKYKLNS